MAIKTVQYDPEDPDSMRMLIVQLQREDWKRAQRQFEARMALELQQGGKK